MLFALSRSVHLKIRHTYRVGETFYLQLRVPKDLHGRFPKALIRETLGTTDAITAAREVDKRVKRYSALFAAMRGNDDLKPADLTVAASALAKEYGNVDVFAELLAEPKFRRHAESKGIADDPDLLDFVKHSDYLTPVESEALRLLQSGKANSRRLSDAFIAYEGTHKKANDADFMAAARRDWELLTSLTGDLPIEDLTREHGRKFITERLRKVKTTSVRRSLAHINAVINRAWKEWSLNIVNPFDSLDIPGEGDDAAARAIPTNAQVKEMLGKFRNETRSTALLTVLHICTGARVGELAGLAKADVVLDYEIPYIDIKPHPWRSLKTKASIRKVPLTPIAREALEKALKQSEEAKKPENVDALFPEYAKPRGADSASAAVNKRLKDWGVTSHGFRHWLKDALRDAGCPKDIRDAIQGHASGDAADLYGLGHSLQTKRDWLTKVQDRLTAA